MPSLSDSVGAEMVGKLPGTAEKSLIAGKEALKLGKNLFKGLCISFKTTGKLSTDTLMKAIKKFLDMQSSGVQYSASNVSMEELQKSGNVSAIKSEIAEEIMKPLDKVCREAGVKYRALYNADTKQYLLFFSARDTEVINACLMRAYSKWQNEQQNADMNKTKGTAEKKPSVRNKLAFFRERIKKYNENRKKMKNQKREYDRGDRDK